MALDESVFFATVGELSAKLRGGEFSAAELTRAFSGRLDRLGPKYNALALPLRDTAVKLARKVDDDLKRQRFRGPLQGIPYGAKDLLSVALQPTTWGAKPYASQRFDFDAAVIARLAKAGAPLIGKLAMIELAGGGGYRYASASLQGPGLNPWDRTRWSGGSSSGSAIAVCAGLAPFAIGSETWGSILTPCAYSGVTGLRPTYGLVSRYGAMALAWTMDKIGPIARSADDCGIVLQAIAGGDSNDSGSAGKGFYYAPQYARPLKELRAGYAQIDIDGWAEPETRPLFAGALDTLRELGLPLKDTGLPEFPYREMAETIIGAEGSAVFEPLIESGRVDELADKKQIAGLRAGLGIAAKDYLKAMRLRRLAQEAIRRMFVDFDVLVSPARFSTATRLEEPLDAPPSFRERPKERGFRDLSAAGNLAGLPALVLPCGFAGGLPVAIQLVGRPYSENSLLKIGREFQSRTDWHRRRPSVETK